MNIGYTNQKIIEEFDKQYYQVNSYDKLIKKFINWINCPPFKDESTFYFNFKEKIYLIEYIEYETKTDIFYINILPKNEPKKGLALYIDRKSEYLRNIGFEYYLKQYIDFVFSKI